MNPSPDSSVAKLAQFRARTQYYARLGYDRRASARFVVQTGEPLSGVALDIGTGKGVTALALAERELDVVSVDTAHDEQVVAALLAEEEGYSPHIRFLTADAATLPFPAAHFGCAVMMDVLHHLEDCVPILHEAARLLRPGGTFIVADFTSEGFEIVARAHREEGREHPVSGVTLEDAAACLRAVGFQSKTRRSGHLQDVLVLAKPADG